MCMFGDGGKQDVWSWYMCLLVEVWRWEGKRVVQGRQHHVCSRAGAEAGGQGGVVRRGQSAAEQSRTKLWAILSTDPVMCVLTGCLLLL
jgi:hypothetical protein